MHKFKLRLSKRKRFVITSGLLTIAILTGNHYITANNATSLVQLLVLLVSSYLLTYWSLKEDIRGIELLTLFLIPVLFTIGTLEFIHILPERKIYRYPIIAAYPIAMYAILLTNNIFNVAAIRTIQLLRAARAVAYLMTIVTTYLMITTISAQIDQLALKLFCNALLFALISYQFFWSFDLGKGEGSKVRWYTITNTVLLTQISLLLQITPINASLEGLIMITSLYCILGISTHNLERKLTNRIATEYIVIASIIIMLVFYTLPWVG